MKSLQYRPMEKDGDADEGGLLTTTLARGVLPPGEMAGVEWWREEWFSEWKRLANIKSDPNRQTQFDNDQRDAGPNPPQDF